MSDEKLDELDRLAAIHVMGWNDVYEHLDNGHWYADGLNMSAKMDWKPTRNIAQSWQLLGKFDIFSMKCNPVESISRALMTECEPEDKFVVCVEWDGNRYYAYAATAPLAIIKACLAAKGVEVKE